MTHNTREGIEDWRKQIEGALNRHYNFFICGEAYPKESEFKKVVLQDIETVLHQELQKAREEEQTRIADYLRSQRYRDQPVNDESEDWVVDWDDVAFILSHNDQSELDQPIS